jgi:misacylated tRNA(Ala) deacylase
MNTITEELFREDSTLLNCEAQVLALEALPEGGWRVALDRTVFYPLGGGQAGDAGVLQALDAPAASWAVSDTVKDKTSGHLWHLLVADSSAAPPRVGQRLRAEVNAVRRQAHMRFHTATHLLCALLPYPVNGCSITERYARLDFHTDVAFDKETITTGLRRLVAEAHPVRHRWISEEELDANPGLVRSMSVQPPRGTGRVRVLEVQGVDLQPCGGTHVANTAEIGDVQVTKIEKKSAMTRRVILGFAEPSDATPG